MTMDFLISCLQPDQGMSDLYLNFHKDLNVHAKTAKTLTSLHHCAGWSGSFLFSVCIFPPFSGTRPHVFCLIDSAGQLVVKKEMFLSVLVIYQSANKYLTVIDRNLEEPVCTKFSISGAITSKQITFFSTKRVNDC